MNCLLRWTWLHTLQLHVDLFQRILQRPFILELPLSGYLASMLQEDERLVDASGDAPATGLPSSRLQMHCQLRGLLRPKNVKRSSQPCPGSLPRLDMLPECRCISAPSNSFTSAAGRPTSLKSSRIHLPLSVSSACWRRFTFSPATAISLPNDLRLATTWNHLHDLVRASNPLVLPSAFHATFAILKLA